MTGQRPSRFIRCSLLAIALAMIGLPASAQSSAPRNLAGWWISIDETGFKPLWDSGVTVPLEELLIVDGEGRFENRAMGFYSVDREHCSQGGVCSDAPLIATGRLTLSGPSQGSAATLTVEDYRATSNRIDAARVDPAIRSAAVSSTRVWPVGRLDTAEGVLVLRKGTGHETRTFFRIEPDRLRRLRAGLMEPELTATRHWRCWIAAATGAARPSPGLRPAAVLGSPVSDYIRVASYLQTADGQLRRPTADDPDAAQRKLAGVAVEELMSERFDSLPPPKTFEERRKPALAAAWIRLVGQGQTPDAAKAAMQRYSPQFEPPTEITAGETAALALVRADTAEAKRLFCKP
jgi:hypothetical protein